MILESQAVAQRVRTHIARLRAKLNGDHHRDVIRTEVGVGYRFAGLARTASSLTPPRQHDRHEIVMRRSAFVM
jgi:DNA-binding winged helix-turn-helix (wHTH) protein